MTTAQEVIDGALQVISASADGRELELLNQVIAAVPLPPRTTWLDQPRTYKWATDVETGERGLVWDGR